MTILRSIVLCVLALALAGCGDQLEREALADFEGLTDGWNVIEPGGDTVCSDGSAYRFHVRPGDPEKLLFYLEGGGACWMGSNCDPHLQPTYQINLASSDPSQSHGIFAFDEPRNPFADYTVVHAPYCSGDVHLGDIEQQYRAPEAAGHEPHDLVIQHRGWPNARSALQWVQRHVFSPRHIFVTGSSAGSIPSPFYAVKLAEFYDAARVTQLGDGSGGYRGFSNFTPYEAWDTDAVVSGLRMLRNVPAGEFGFQHLYLAAAEEHPSISMASYDTAEDEVQKQFLELGGIPAQSLRPTLLANLEQISGEVPAYRYYVAPGELHTILRRPEVYSYSVNGVAFVDWLTRLAQGLPVNNVMCLDCDTALSVSAAH